MQTLLQDLGGYTRGCADIRAPKSYAGLLERLQQHDGDIPSGAAMVLEATMICIDNSEWPPHWFSNGKPLFWINLFQQHSPEHCRTPAGRTKIPAVSTRVMPSKG